MKQNALDAIRFFLLRFRQVRFGASGRRSALLIFNAALLSSIAGGQVPTTTALPYLLTDQAGVVEVVTSGPVFQVPPAVGLSGFGSLLGGGLGSVFDSTTGPASAAALAAVRSILLVKKANAARAKFQQLNSDTTNGVDNAKRDLDLDGCDETVFRARLRTKLKAAAFPHKWKPTDSPACTLPQEQEAQEAEAELEQLNESGEAAQEAIEGAEQAAEAAEAAAEAAETAAEAALDGLDVLEALLDALSLV